MDANEIQTGSTAIDDIAIGERYFLRGVFYDSWVAIESGNPLQFRGVFIMHPLSEITDGLLGERSIPGNGVWYVVAPPGEPLDLHIRGLDNLYSELRWIEHSLSMVRLQTTEDMSYMPYMQPRSGARCVLTAGRWITREDNEHSNPVVAVHQAFASMRGLAIGDTLRIGIPPEQHWTVGASICGDDYLWLFITSNVHASYAQILELEIVGIFDFVNTSGSLGSQWATTFIYMPDSALPSDANLTGYDRTRMIGEEIVTITYEEGYILAEWYT
jgi:hypothetical protein